MMMCPDDGDDDDVTNKLNIMKGRRRLLVALCTTTSATAAALTSPTRPFSANAADLSLSERMRAPKSLVKPVERRLEDLDQVKGKDGDEVEQVERVDEELPETQDDGIPRLARRNVASASEL